MHCNRFVGLGVMSVNGGAGQGACGTGAGAGRLAVSAATNIYEGRYEAQGAYADCRSSLYTRLISWHRW